MDLADLRCPGWGEHVDAVPPAYWDLIPGLDLDDVVSAQPEDDASCNNGACWT